MTPAATRRTLLAGLATLPFAARPSFAQTSVLRIGDQKGGAQSLVKAAGVLDNLPYRIEWSQFPAAAPLLEALNAGAVDLALAGDAPTTFALAAGVPARIVSPIRTRGLGTAIMVPQSSPIRTVADLRGRAVATNRGSIGHALILALAAAQGWKPSEIKLVNLLPVEAKAALAAGVVDAWSSWGVYVAQARLVDNARIIADGSNGTLTNLSYLLVSNAAIASHRPAILDFARRLAAARRWAIAHPDDYAAILAAEIGVTPQVARLVFDNDTPKPTPIDPAVIADEQKNADLFLAAGIIRTHLDVRDFFDPSFNEALAI